MGVAIFKVEEPGLYASIQDKGRFGYQQYGVPTSGAVDRYAHHMANYILGNDEYKATIEITLTGTVLRALKSHAICITGADLDASIDDKRVPLWKTIHIKEGQILKFGKPNNGVRAYIGAAGGIVSSSFLGSYSVYERGHMGKRLEKDNIIHAGEIKQKIRNRKLSPCYIPSYSKNIELRVISSHHSSKFTRDAIQLLFSQIYTLQSGDRMGCHLRGDIPLQHKYGADIISESTTFGTIQVPARGQPIILLADSQTTGGYTTIGTVIRADLWKIAQLQQGGKIKFKSVTIEEAESLSKQWFKFDPLASE